MCNLHIWLLHNKQLLTDVKDLLLYNVKLLAECSVGKLPSDEPCTGEAAHIATAHTPWPPPAASCEIRNQQVYSAFPKVMVRPDFWVGY